ncbi:MAG: hypothetical protein H6736_22070 [Alphaproteobacteria bacterium]|nr:hypothetical protein [Alphaproteobacteria bacterium]
MRSLDTDLEDLVRTIAALNRAWKIFRDREPKSPLAAALRDGKSAAQLELLRRFPEACDLVRDDAEGHELYSVRLNRPVRLANGVVLNDAMHLPVEVVREYLPSTQPGRM